MKTVFFCFNTCEKTSPASATPAPSEKVKQTWCNRTEKPSTEELEEGVYLCVVHDIFITLRLLSCAAVNMMDNVLRLGLLGVICCLYHGLWRAETGREREKLTEGGKTERAEEAALITDTSCWGLTKLGRFEV